MEPTERRPPAVDETLRRSLEPHPEVVDRLVQRALASERRRGSIGPAWRLAGVAAAALLLALLVPRFLPRSPGPAPPEVVGLPAPPAAVLKISNEGGPVTVTTPAGSRMIILPGDVS